MKCVNGCFACLFLTRLSLRLWLGNLYYWFLNYWLLGFFNHRGIEFIQSSPSAADTGCWDSLHSFTSRGHIFVCVDDHDIVPVVLPDDGNVKKFISSRECE